jgi:hypothetical protein
MKTNIHLWLYLAQVFLEWEMFQTEVVEKTQTHFMFHNLFYENRGLCAVYEVMWENIVEPGRPQMTI